MQRIRRNAFILLMLLGTTAFLARGWGEGLSVLLGGALAFLNMRLLSSAVDRFLGRRKGPGGLIVAVWFGGRVLLILLAFFAIIQTSFLSVLGALVGLSVFVLSGFLEAILLVLRREK